MKVGRPVWGWARNEISLTTQLIGDVPSATANRSDRWMVMQLTRSCLADRGLALDTMFLDELPENGVYEMIDSTSMTI